MTWPRGSPRSPGLGPSYEDSINAPNLGQVPELPWARWWRRGAFSTPPAFARWRVPLPPTLEPVVRPHVLRQELTVEAGVEGDFEKAVAVLASEPLVHHVGEARPMLERMLGATQGVPAAV